MAGHPVTRQIPIDLPAQQPEHDVLAALWARTKIDDLMHSGATDVQPQITQLGLDYKLMTPFTSFVAVEEVVVTQGGQPRRVDVPVEMPEGVSYEGVFGEAAAPMAMALQMPVLGPPQAVMVGPQPRGGRRRRCGR